MSNTIVKSQLEDVAAFLGETVKKLESYLNSSTLDGLLSEKNGDEAFYKNVLSNIRKIVVYSEESLEACQIILQNEVFHKGAAEKILYRVYHQVIEEYFSPKYDCWYEDSRSAYTGRNSIKFRQDVPNSLSLLLKSLEAGFQTVREDLEFYETDYRTKMIQSN